MIRLLLIAYVSLLQYRALAQRKVDVDKTDGLPMNTFYSVAGQPFINTKFVRLVAGTPYFKDEWMKGMGISDKGIQYKAGMLKLDLIDGEVHYLDSAGNEMIATSNLKQIILTDTLTNLSYHFIHSTSLAISPLKKGWYLQLASGKTSLYQYFLKQVSETLPYGSATTEQRIHTSEEFYLLHNNTLAQVKKPKDILKIIPDKSKELEEFLKKIDKAISTPTQLAVLVSYYNSLQ